MFIQPSVLAALINLGGVSDAEIYYAAVEAFRREHSGLAPAGTYERDLITSANGIRKEERITVFRFRPPDGPAYAVIPDCLIPGSSYSIRFVLIPTTTSQLQKYPVSSNQHRCSPGCLFTYFYKSTTALIFEKQNANKHSIDIIL